MDAFLAVDWGTTNRRVFRIEQGMVAASERDGKGAASLPPADYPAEVAATRREPAQGLAAGDRQGVPEVVVGVHGAPLGPQEVGPQRRRGAGEHRPLGVDHRHLRALRPAVDGDDETAVGGTGHDGATSSTGRPSASNG